MENKTCGECRFYNSDYNLCFHWRHEDINEHSPICNYFKPLTNGDVIRQGGNKRLITFSTEWSCFRCAYHNGIEIKCERPEGKDCFDGMEAWLNAPADYVAENGKSAKQADLCCKSAKESEVYE